MTMMMMMMRGWFADWWEYEKVCVWSCVRVCVCVCGHVCEINPWLSILPITVAPETGHLRGRKPRKRGRSCVLGVKEQKRNEGVDEKATATEKVKFKIPPGTTEKRATGGEHDYRREEGGGGRTTPLTVPCRCTWAWPPSGCSVRSPPAEGATSPRPSAAGPPRSERRWTASVGNETDMFSEAQRDENETRSCSTDEVKGHRHDLRVASVRSRLFCFWFTSWFFSGCKKTFNGFVSHFINTTVIVKQVLKPEIS